MAAEPTSGGSSGRTFGNDAAPAGPLTPAARRGYGLGSVATGVVRHGARAAPAALPHRPSRGGRRGRGPGRLPAQGVGRRPQPGRGADQRPLRHPAGRAPAVPLRVGLALAVAFVLLFTGPTSRYGRSPRPGSSCCFLACATAYAFFQVPYVAMPAEMTDDYDERTRLMTWRVAILALAILVSGGLSPVIRDALGARAGLPRRWACSSRRSSCSARWARGAAPAAPASAGCRHGRRQPARPAPGGRGRARLPRCCSRRSCSRRWRPARCSPGSTTSPGCCSAARAPHHPVRLLRRARAAGHAALGSGSATRRGKRTGYVCGVAAARRRRARRRAAAQVGAAAAVCLRRRLVGVGYAGCQMFPLAMLPDVAAADAARTGESRAGVFTGVWTAGETLGLALGPGLYAVVLALGGYVSSTGCRRRPARLGASRRSRSASPSSRPRSSRPQPAGRSRLPARRGRCTDDRTDDGRPPAWPAPTRCSRPLRGAPGARPARPTAAAPSPTSTTPAWPTPTPIGREASPRSPTSNGLDPTAFPRCCDGERPRRHRRPDCSARPRASPASVTSGGTESILLAVKAARDAPPGDHRARAW